MSAIWRVLRLYERLAAVCDMPLALLFGSSMNATGESDTRFFYSRFSRPVPWKND